MHYKIDQHSSVQNLAANSARREFFGGQKFSGEWRRLRGLYRRVLPLSRTRAWRATLADGKQILKQVHAS